MRCEILQKIVAHMHRAEYLPLLGEAVNLKPSLICKAIGRSWCQRLIRTRSQRAGYDICPLDRVSNIDHFSPNWACV